MMHRSTYERLVYGLFYRKTLNRQQAFIVNHYSCVDENRCYVYFRVPKSGNTTMISTLLGNNPKNQAGIRKNSFRRIFQTFGDLMSNERTVKFSVVRDPYSRLLSAYLQKVEAGVKLDAIAASGLFKNGHAISFEQFVSYLVQGGLYKNGHWMPQSFIVPTDKFPQIRIFKLENLPEALQELQALIGPLALQDQRRHATNANDRLSSFCTGSLKARVRKLYQKDFELFGYESRV